MANQYTKTKLTPEERQRRKREHARIRVLSDEQKEAKRLYHKNYRALHKNEWKEYKNQNRQKIRDNNARYIAKPEKREHKNQHNRDYIAETKRLAVALYGGKCIVCGEDDLCMLSLDHIHDDGAKDPGGTHFYRQLLKSKRDDLQCMCMGCQWRKRTRGGDFTKWPNYIAAKVYTLAEYAARAL